MAFKKTHLVTLVLPLDYDEDGCPVVYFEHGKETFKLEVTGEARGPIKKCKGGYRFKRKKSFSDVYQLTRMVHLGRMLVCEIDTSQLVPTLKLWNTMLTSQEKRDRPHRLPQLQGVVKQKRLIKRNFPKFQLARSW